MPRLRDDGTVVVHSHDKGYRTVARLSAMASELIGSQIHVITDDVPGADDAPAL
jgi:biotin operon repressor